MRGRAVGEVLRRIKGGRFIGFYLRFYEAGRRRCIPSRQTRHAEARKLLLAIEARIARGQPGLPAPVRARLTVAQLVERFLCEYSRPRLKSLEAYRHGTRSCLKKVVVLVGKRLAEELVPGDIARVRDTLLRTHAPGTVRQALVRLSAVLSWGVREGLIRNNPCRGVERPVAARALDFLSREEVAALLEAADRRASAPSARIEFRMLHLGILLAAHTGLRKGELLGLRWTDLDLARLRLTVARSYRDRPKGGRARHLRLPSVLVPALRAWQKVCPPSPDGSVLPLGRGRSRVGGPTSMLGLPELLRELGMRKVRHPWHLLRHTFASHFVMAGGNLLALQEILGHKDVKMTMLYAHLAPEYLGREMERVTYARPTEEDEEVGDQGDGQGPGRPSVRRPR
ncbi:MAG: site-specific integrase [Polyangia bacterium]